MTMKTVLLLGAAGLVAWFLLRPTSSVVPIVPSTSPIGAPPAATVTNGVVGPSSEARSGRGHF